MPESLDSHAHQPRSNDDQSSTYVSIYLSSSCPSLSCVLSDGPDFPIQSVFCLWKTHAGSLCPCAWRCISFKLFQMHGMSPHIFIIVLSLIPRQDCGDIVASKFFPLDRPDGKQDPLCERDYFRRLNLVCGKCGMALRGSYIIACSQSPHHRSGFILFLTFPASFFRSSSEKKYHVEHFTCSICPTLFGPQDSYYKHDGDVYCHFHYSTRFATKCAGCSMVIVKQLVEVNRNMQDECWHPECYMIDEVRSCFLSLIGVFPHKHATI
jgi:hypothetical protein